jgi:FtsP/CotA-like multicopper oxidase with cupredoxin domain
MNTIFPSLAGVCLAALFLAPTALACKDCGKERYVTGKVVEYDLRIAEQTLMLADKPVAALTINGSVPGPTLRFQEGDLARIRVHNDLRREETSTHWHGLLLPNEQDGVPHVTTPPIKPGTFHTFEFVLRHAGTYWYHSHTHLQEQRGVYGAIVVLPRPGTPTAASDRADRDEVLVLSDWTNESPDEVLRTLARGSEYYLLRRGTAQSLFGAVGAGALGEYLAREWSKMPPMDVADVAYDAFLVNGRREWKVPGRPGERVRLRIVNAAASTYFYLHWSAGPLKIIEADGMPVVPVSVPRLLMGVAETYDVIVTIPRDGEWELRATAMDGSGHASALLGDGERHAASDPPKPRVYSMDEMVEMALAEKDENPRAVVDLPRPGPPYALLRARGDTRLPASAPTREISMRLTGDMGRYTWSFNGKTMAEEGIVWLRHGEVVRLEMVNDTMMHHPIHLHGHFFRVLNGQGARSPLKHTVDVPPMGRRVIEFEANERHGWLFHCHILYHMMTGMGRVFWYEEDPMAPLSGHATAGSSPRARSLGDHAHEMWFAWGEASLLSNMSDGLFTVRNGRRDLLLDWEIGWEDVDETEYEGELVLQHYFSPDFQAFAGARLDHDDDGTDTRAVAGFNYRLPLRIQSRVSLDSEGDARFEVGHEIPLTSRLSAFGRVEYDTGTEWEWAAGASYTLSKAFSVTAQFHSEYGLGAGLSVRF